MPLSIIMPRHNHDWNEPCPCNGCAPDDRLDDDDWHEDADEPTIPCPNCRHEIFEDAPQCPHCGQYISEEDAPPQRKPWWVVVGALLCLAVVWTWIASR